MNHIKQFKDCLLWTAREDAASDPGAISLCNILMHGSSANEDGCHLRHLE